MAFILGFICGVLLCGVIVAGVAMSTVFGILMEGGS